MKDLEQQNSMLEGVHYATGKVTRLGIRGGMIYSLSESDDPHRSGGDEREKLPVIAPGLTDLQINGYNGVDFNAPEMDPEQFDTVSAALLELGVTHYYPTLITGSKKRISAAIRTMAQVTGQKGPASRMIGGIHLEGPFISKEDGPRGAHPKRYCLDPDTGLVEKWQNEARGRIRIITLAPELPGSTDLIKACTGLGMVVAIGHTAAQSDDIKRAVDAGARLSTHLGNGAHNLLPRHPNYIWDQLAEERLFATMIADGFHLPDAVLKVFYRAKREKTILVSDGMPYAGMEPGTYISPSAGRICLTPEGKLHREGHPELLAGSAGTLPGGVQKMASLAGFAEAWDMASIHPARLMDPGAAMGLKVGAPADLVLLEPGQGDLKVRRVYKNGSVLWKGSEIR